MTALGLMSAAGIPVPLVLGWRRGEPGVPSWVLLAYVAHDDDPDVPLRQLGEMTRRLHDIRPRLPGLEPAGDWATFMCDRLFQRLAVVAVEEIDDARMHAEQAARTRYLASRIAQRVASAR